MSIFIEPEFTASYEQHPLVLVDVGASGGLEENWAAAAKYLRVIGFDADERASEGANHGVGSRVLLHMGLHKEKGTVTFYLTRKQQASSMFRPNRGLLDRFNFPDRFDVVGTKTINVDMLDQQLSEHGIADVDFIKVDTQGSELFILQGAPHVLSGGVFGVEVEVEFAEIYEGQPLFADVDKFLRPLGFHLFDLKLSHMKRAAGKQWGKRKGQLVYGDALYLKDSSMLAGMYGQLPEDQQRSKVLRALSVCFLYGYFDMALEIFDCQRHLFTEKQRATVLARIQSVRSLSSRIPIFRGRQRMANILSRLWDIVEPTYESDTTFQRHLGNL